MHIKSTIKILGCDCQYVKNYNISCIRPKGVNKDFHLLYIAQGCCHIMKSGTEIRAEAGSVITYFPGEEQHYSFASDEVTTSYYIHFKGDNAEELIKDIGIGCKRIVNIGVSSTVINIFDKLISEFSLKKNLYEYYCHGLIFELFTVISRKANSNINDTRFQTTSRLNRVRRIMHDQFNITRTVSDYANMCHLSENRFSVLFKEEFGVSPNQYITQVKIQKAKDLLNDTDMSIAQISEFLGMTNQNYFSRMFKKHTGLSPIAYKNR
ncbi:MAG: helix-turn-helix transcriptional regulator [Clostridia bacterium]|nr:helix-turn-helix transcriptional regulator [Clostridia bacterium]